MDTMTTARTGLNLVATQLVRRGLQVTECREGRRLFLRVETRHGWRVIAVSTRTGGTWQTSTRYGSKPAPQEGDGRLWVFVDLSVPTPSYYVVPYRWMSEDIHDAHTAYLARHGGRRAGNPKSSHHAVQEQRIAQWQDRWDLLDS